MIYAEFLVLVLGSKMLSKEKLDFRERAKARDPGPGFT